MLFNKFKSISIILLSIFAVYQTAELWLGDFSSRNFFYSLRPSFFEQTSGSEAEALEALLTPPRLIVSTGDNRFGIIYDNISISQAKLDCDKAITLALTKGIYVSTSNLDWTSVLKSRSLIYEYSVPIPASVIAKALGQRSNILTSRAKQIDMIIAAPNRTNSEQLVLLFIDTGNMLVYEYAADSSDLNSRLLKDIQDVQGMLGSFYYLSTALSGFETFERNTFVPRWTGDYYPYNAITYTNPYSENGDEPLLYTVEKKVDVFFNNPSTKDTKKIKGIYTYSGDSALVRYKQSSVLEYFNYRPISKVDNADLGSSFAAASHFLKKDSTILNTIYLADARNDGSQWVFYFDYAVNNLPIYLSTTQKEETGLSHAIEVTVENNEVLQYKRYVCALKADESVVVNAYTDFLSALDDVIDREAFDEVGTPSISNIELAYRIDKDKAIILHWFLNINGVEYLKNAQ